MSLVICVTCHPTQMNTPSLTAARQAGTQLTNPGGMEGWVNLGGWIYTEMVYLSTDSHEWAWCRAALLIKSTNALTTIPHSLLIHPSVFCLFLCELLIHVYFRIFVVVFSFWVSVYEQVFCRQVEEQPTLTDLICGVTWWTSVKTLVCVRSMMSSLIHWLSVNIWCSLPRYIVWVGYFVGKFSDVRYCNICPLLCTS